MCLILFAYRAHPDFELVVAANRDEFFARPTAPADYWDDAPSVLGGRDLDKGGTWMGVTRSGRWAALTNFRDGAGGAPGTQSRGLLVSDYLTGNGTAQAYANSAARAASRYAGFNLLVGDGSGLYYVSHDQGARRVSPGVHGLSNHRLDTPWPKVENGMARVRDALDGPGDALDDRLLAILADDVLAPDHLLPATGIAADWEKRLSAAFIRAPGYGTRSSSVLLIGTHGDVRVRERNFREGGAASDERMFRFTVAI